MLSRKNWGDYMAKKITIESVRKEMSTSLLALERTLSQKSQGIILNPEVLKSSANAVERKRNSDLWAYNVSGLMLRVDVPQKTIPVSCISPLQVKINLELEGRLDDGTGDQLTKLVLDLGITSESGEHVCAWHFDRHIEGGNSTDAHPLYHFQHGGHAMKPYIEELGRSLILPAPRLAFPPMDAILSIDFVLSNFSGDCWSSLKKDPTYLHLLRASQRTFWKPYLTSLASWWDAPVQKKQHISRLLPHLA